MELTLAGAKAQAAALAAGDVSAVELLEAVVARYERFNPLINAVVVERIDEARVRAVEADAATARGISWGPLHGVPMTIKEAWLWAGTPSTSGYETRRGHVAERTDPAVQRLLDAGAVIYGKTNLPVGMADWQTFNPIYGTTGNPWDPERIPGGSSGGSAAAVAAGMAALELGSDIGASIRNPAHYCGVFGHKPTYGLVPIDGHGSPGDPRTLDIGVGGPIARTAGDLQLGLDITAGPAGLDARGWRLDLPAPRFERPDRIRAAVMLESPCCEQDDELTEQLARTVDALDERGGEPLLGVQALSYGGGKMPRPVIERALELFPITNFVNAYGLTETSSTIALLGPDEHRIAQYSDESTERARLGSVGRPLPGIEVAIRDDDGIDLPAGEVGEIFQRVLEGIRAAPGPALLRQIRFAAVPALSRWLEARAGSPDG